MAKGTIEWCDYTFNTHWGCLEVSPACDRCYAREVSHRWGFDVWGKDKDRRFFGDKHWNEPLKWEAQAAKARKRARVFTNSMSDIFEDRTDLDPVRLRLWKLIEQTPHLDYLLLTKRADCIARMLPEDWLVHPRHNVWLGVTGENVRRFHERMASLATIPAAVHFVSYEPALEDISREIEEWRFFIKWLIIGGESGPGARPMPVEWCRGVLNACREHGIRFFMKQLGGFPDKRKDMKDFPEDLRVREFPKVRGIPPWNPR